MDAYGEQSYWDKRYSIHAGHFEWYEMDWEDLLAASPELRIAFDALKQHQAVVRCLEVGCGTSAVGPQLASLPHFDVTCVDYSPVAIAWMQRTHGESSFLRFVCANALNLSAVAAKHSFDVTCH